ncbi:hypothetical protein ONN26_25480, partial [Salmonella enterica subsp. enterica serovar Muenster]|nr:hypothetical protein [Salmonella enterica subsp. enterica serovar Muenster]
LPPGATVEHMLMEGDDQKLLMASDAGYGFVCTFNDLVARNRAGETRPGNLRKPRSTGFYVRVWAKASLLISVAVMPDSYCGCSV